MRLDVNSTLDNGDAWSRWCDCAWKTGKAEV